MVKGRFAPSPTGRMHLGNIWCALVSWLSAKSQDGTWLLRIEDLDQGRSRREFSEQIESDLSILGLDWDEGGLQNRGSLGPYSQSQRSAIYEEQLSRISHLSYPCSCKRADLLAANAPHASDGRVVYSGKCRPAHLSNLSYPYGTIQPAQNPTQSDCPTATRIIVPDADIHFTDGNYGPQCVNLARECGDFVVRRADGGWAYQLAVVVDDALMGVTEVVRGEDLLLSTPQQIYLHELLGFNPPAFAHIPLVCNQSGQRLCKRDKDMDMGELLKRYKPEEIIGLIAYAGGLIDKNEPCTAAELISEFSWDKVPTESIIL